MKYFVSGGLAPFVAIACIFSSTHAQVGSIAGKVADSQTGEELVGATVVVTGTKIGASTDLSGEYTVRNVPAGIHSLRLSFVGYTPKTVSGVTIVAGQTVHLDLTLAAESYQTEEIVVTAQKVLSTESSLLSERKKAAAIGDAISIEQIKRSPDATSGDALKRVTGVSVVDNKFVFIRGITDRYNGTTLDGSSVTSTEEGKKGFSFDLVPSNLIENTTVVKSATPDLPGDFTGGLVQLNTLDFPDRSMLKMTMGSSYNDVTTSNGFISSRGSRNFLGYDDGSRDFPGQNPDLVRLAQNMRNTWGTKNGSAGMNSSFALVYGDRFTLEDESMSPAQVGLMTALTYRSGFQRSDRIVDDQVLGRVTAGPTNSYDVLWGAIGNLNVKLSEYHKVRFKNSFSHSSEDEVSIFRRSDVDYSYKWYTNQYSERSAYTGSVLGDHVFPSLGSLSLRWRGSVSSSLRQDPDYKEAVYVQPLDDPSRPFEISSSNRRYWSHMNDRTLSGAMDLSVPVMGGKLKWGALTESRTMNYEMNIFGLDYLGYPDSLLRLPIDVVFSPENFGPRKFRITQGPRKDNYYEGDSRLYAGYLMLDLPFELLPSWKTLSTRFRLTGGARLENFEQNVNIPSNNDPGGPMRRYQLKNVDILPSLNLTYIATDEINLRFAYSHSVNRPEFKERANIFFEDRIKYEIVGGDTGLQRAFVHNYDVRLEFFPGIGEVFAISYFAKRISGAIELQQIYTNGSYSRIPFNSQSAVNTGWEIEARKSLDFLGGYMRNFSMGANYSRIFSTVEEPVQAGNSLNTVFGVIKRPMVGQSPYMINVSFLFTEPTIGTSVSILYNRFGERIQTVGRKQTVTIESSNDLDIYEEPRDVIDVSVLQPLFAGFDTKLTIRNLGDKDKILSRQGKVYESATIGRTFTLQFSLTL